MSTRRHISKKVSFDASFSPVTNPLQTRGFGKGIQARRAALPTTNLLQTRPFGSSAMTSPEQPDTRSIEAQQSDAANFGYNGANIPIHAPVTPPLLIPIQKKEGELGSWYQPPMPIIAPMLNPLNRIQTQPFPPAQTSESKPEGNATLERSTSGETIQRLCSEFDNPRPIRARILPSQGFQ
ncbi:hypothetical protein [Coleofasciculus sp. G2-EDA-02]|uniref:hypothetical protein n=1 Tax=Coleofasciculus sp. G2-EDA-02 TaxID=3069529 RepID=UPI003300214E